MKNRRNSSALTMELRLFCIKSNAMELRLFCIKPSATELRLFCIKPSAMELRLFCIKSNAMELRLFSIKPSKWSWLKVSLGAAVDILDETRCHSKCGVKGQRAII